MADDFSGRLTTGAQRILEMIQKAGRPQVYDSPVSVARAAMQRLGHAFDMPEQPVGRFEALTLDAGDREIPIEITWPLGHKGETLPLVMYFHGGGFVLGRHSQFRRVVSYLTNKAGVVVVNVDYRLAPEHKFPSGLNDCLYATQWAVDNAADLSADTGRLFVAGDSAGGNLATGVARLLRDDPALPNASGQVLIYPVTDFSVEHASRIKFERGKMLERRAMSWYEENYIGSEKDRQNPLVSPLVADDLAGLPPACILTAEMDILRDEGVAYADKLKSHGVAVDHSNWPGMIHGFVNMASMLPEAYLALDHIAQWINDMGSPSLRTPD